MPFHLRKSEAKTLHLWRRRLGEQLAAAGAPMDEARQEALLAELLGFADWPELLATDAALAGLASDPEPAETERLRELELARLGCQVKALRRIFAAAGQPLAQGKAREQLAALFGQRNWNTLIAMVKKGAAYLGPHDYPPPLDAWREPADPPVRLLPGVYLLPSYKARCLMIRKSVALAHLSDACIRLGCDFEDYWQFNGCDGEVDAPLLEMPELWPGFYGAPIDEAAHAKHQRRLSEVLVSSDDLAGLGPIFGATPRKQQTYAEYLALFTPEGRRAELLASLHRNQPLYLLEAGLITPDDPVLPQRWPDEMISDGDEIDSRRLTHDRRVLEVTTGFENRHYILSSGFDDEDWPRLSECVEVARPEVVRSLD